METPRLKTVLPSRNSQSNNVNQMRIVAMPYRAELHTGRHGSIWELRHGLGCRVDFPGEVMPETDLEVSQVKTER